MNPTIRILTEAKHEITILRRQNEILRAKVEVMDLFACVLHTQPASREQGMLEDITWIIDKEAARLEEADKQAANRAVNAPLNCSVEGTDLVIRIGVGTLAWAAKKKNGGPIENRVRIADKMELAKDVSSELMREDELGNMPITELLDDAIKSAADQGSCAFVYPRQRVEKLARALLGAAVGVSC